MRVDGAFIDPLAEPGTILLRTKRQARQISPTRPDRGNPTIRTRSGVARRSQALEPE